MGSILFFNAQMMTTTYNCSYLKFPNFAVAPTSYIERKQSSQEQVEKPEKLRFELSFSSLAELS